MVGLQRAEGQGTVVFNNRVTGVVMAPIYAPDGAGGLARIGTRGLYGQWGASTTMAQLLAAPGAGEPESVLVPALPVTTFRTGSAAGYVVAATATLAGVPADYEVATVQMVVWDNSSGLYPSWVEAEMAWMSGFLATAKSPKFNLYGIGGVVNAPPNLSGLVSFSVIVFDPPPVIHSHPQDQVVLLGGNVTLSVNTSVLAAGCQWYFANAPIEGGTGYSYTITNAQREAEGLYYVIVRNTYGSLQSASARVRVIQFNPELRVNGSYGGLEADRFWFTLLSEPGLRCKVESSSDLVNWAEFAVTTNTTGILRVTNDNPAISPRFFKATQVTD